MKKYCLIGEKLSHSYSAEIHKSEGFSYTLEEVESGKLEDFVLKSEYDGFNVTIPYKKAIIPYLDYVSPFALNLGAVNTVVRKNGRLLGYNTDVFGADISIKKCRVDARNKNVLILGNGGAGGAIGSLMRDEGAKSISFTSRRGDLNYDNVYKKCSQSNIIINATPYGMYPNLTDKSLLSLSQFENLELVFDLIYNPFRTSLILDAKKMGVKNISGLYMLVGQAIKSEYIWKSDDESVIDPPISVINKAYRRILNSKLNMYFIGMPGCGKSTIAKEIAKKTNREFIDTDEEIKKKSMLSAEEFINKYGEDAFRDLESDVVKENTKKISSIISLGGGAILRDDSRSFIKQTGIVFYIKRDLKSLPVSSRPLSIKHGVEKLYEMRHALYEECADCVIDNNSSLDKAISNVMSSRDVIN